MRHSPLDLGLSFQCSGPAQDCRMLVEKYEYSEGSEASTDMREPTEPCLQAQQQNLITCTTTICMYIKYLEQVTCSLLTEYSHATPFSQPSTPARSPIKNRTYVRSFMADSTSCASLLLPRVITVSPAARWFIIISVSKVSV